MTFAVRVHDLWKEFRIGGPEKAHDTFYDALGGFLRSPFGALKRRARRAIGDDRFWALREVEFDVEPGEVLGIIGKNGAGKSTLLKILSRITDPTRGRIEIRGRLASLLEVGTGFHPELTGRENIYLNGAILGMTRREITRKFDEIVDFAEVEKFLDTPVKRYSSGMYVRLAFAVAAHLEPDILVVDEVLSVGDASFQKRCLAKMGEVRGEGRTVLFVSHNMAAVHQLCGSVLLLRSGKIVAKGEPRSIVANYLSESDPETAREWTDASTSPGNDRVRLRAVRVLSEGRSVSEFPIDQPVDIEVEFRNYVEGIRHLCVNVYLMDQMGGTILSTANTDAANSLRTDWFKRAHPAGLYKARCRLPANFLNDVRYQVSVYLVTLDPLRVEASAERIVSFAVLDTGRLREPGMGGEWHGVVRVPLPWETTRIDGVKKGQSSQDPNGEACPEFRSASLSD